MKSEHMPKASHPGFNTRLTPEIGARFDFSERGAGSVTGWAQSRLRLEVSSFAVIRMMMWNAFQIPTIARRATKRKARSKGKCEIVKGASNMDNDGFSDRQYEVHLTAKVGSAPRLPKGFSESYIVNKDREGNVVQTYLLHTCRFTNKNEIPWDLRHAYERFKLEQKSVPVYPEEASSN